MKKIIKFFAILLLKTIFYSVTSFTRILGEIQKIKYLSYFLRSLENVNNSFVSYIERPIEADKIPASVVSDDNYSNLAVIIQGPLKIDKNFSLETVKLYKRMFSEACIVVSTWKGENKNYINSLRREGAYVIENSRPKISGIGNINFQLMSTKSGLLFAKEKGCSYAIKTRTDQRLGRNGLFEFLSSLNNIFPVEDVFNINQKGRIIVSEGNVASNMLIPFHVCDFFYYGFLDDLISFFDSDENPYHFSSRIERFNLSEKLKKKNVSLVNYHHSLAPEAILIINYLKRKGVDFDSESLNDSWNFIKSYLISVSWDDLDLIWIKYERRYNEGLLRNISKNIQSNPYYYLTWTFNNWLLVNQGKMKLKIDYEEYCKKGVSNYFNP